MPISKNNSYEIVHKIVTGILVPVIIYILGQINEVKTELMQHEVKAAQAVSNYAMKDDIVRIEKKLDDLRNLFIQELKDHK